MEDITVMDLAARLRDGDAPIIVDVREPDEFAYARIEGALLRPLGGILVWAQELDRDREVVMMCHTGNRSGSAAAFLRKMGFKQVRNLLGGIDAWSVYVDPRVPRY